MEPVDYKDIEAVRQAFITRRLQEGYSIRGMSELINCAFSSIARFEARGRTGWHVLRRIYLWLYPTMEHELPPCRCRHCAELSIFSAKELAAIDARIYAITGAIKEGD